MDVSLAIQQMNEEAARKERISTLLKSIKNLMEKMEWSAEQYHQTDTVRLSNDVNASGFTEYRQYLERKR